MPELPNARHEAFATLVASGLAAGKSYIKAGFRAKNENTANASAMRLLRDATVRARVELLKAPIAERKAEAVRKAASEAIEADIRTRTGRISALADRRRQILAVIAARAVFPFHQDVPGGSTGLVVASYKTVGAKAVKTHEVDIELLRELRETEKQIAQEIGQWSDKITVAPATTEEWWANLTPEQRDAEKARLQAEAARETLQ